MRNLQVRINIMVVRIAFAAQCTKTACGALPASAERRPQASCECVSMAGVDRTLAAASHRHDAGL